MIPRMFGKIFKYLWLFVFEVQKKKKMTLSNTY